MPAKKAYLLFPILILALLASGFALAASPAKTAVPTKVATTKENAAPASTATTITTVGEVFLANITPEEAQSLAVKRARTSAIEQVCGVKIQTETMVKDFVMQADFIHQVAYGRIVGEKVVKWELEVDQPSPLKPPGLALRVTLEVQVMPEKGEPDPFYKVKVWLNKGVFQSGEEMVVSVNATKDSYLTVLNFSADDSVTLLYPNLLRRDNKIEAGRDYEIPAREDRGEIMKFQVATLPDHKQDTEAIKVICTRGPLNLLSEVKARGNYGVMDSTKFAMTEIARLLAAIPPRERAEDTAIYQIVNPRLQ